LSDYHCVCKYDKFIRDRVFDNKEAYNHIFQEKMFSNREILLKKIAYIYAIVYRMYRDRIRDLTNSSTYPEYRDTRCQENECRLYHNLRIP